MKYFWLCLWIGLTDLKVCFAGENVTAPNMRNSSDQTFAILYTLLIASIVVTPIICYKIFAWLLDRHKRGENNTKSDEIWLGVGLTSRCLAGVFIISTFLGCFMNLPFEFNQIQLAFYGSIIMMWCLEWVFIIPAFFAAINRERPGVIQGMMIVAIIVCVLSLGFFGSMFHDY